MPDSKYQPDRARKGRALCLSGGGFRAALFHLGALRRLNEVGLLSTLQTISSVSGGSIANGLLAKVWLRLTPNATGTFTNFLDAYERPLQAFCSQDLRTGPLLTDRLDPRNWPLLLGDDHSATDFLAHAYQDRLVGDLRLKDLAAIRTAGGPYFVFDASNLQTGVNFEFSGDGVGDWRIGHASAPEVLVADAIAASSAFPIAFPPLVLKFEPGLFHGGALAEDPRLGDLTRRVVLSDGGVYDNLGLEPVWKTVIGNQAIAVRKRWLVASYEQGLYRGAYWGIGTEIENYSKRGPGYSGLVLERLRAVRTDLDSFTGEEQLVLINHGWALADAALRTYVGDLLPDPIPPGAPASPHLLSHPDRAAQALAESDKIRPLGR